MSGINVAQAEQSRKLEPHYILCGNDKRPASALGWDSRNWQNNPASPEQAARWHREGNRVGIIPASVGALVIDVDKCPAGKSIADFSALLSFEHRFTESENHNGGHIILRWDGIAQGNSKWQWHNYSGEIRHANGYAIIWNSETWHSAVHMIEGAVSSLPMLNKRKPTLVARKADWANGNRNNTLNRLAFAAAQRSASEDVFDALRKKALEAGLGYGEIEATMASARRAGMSQVPPSTAGEQAEPRIGQANYIFVGDYIKQRGIELRYNEVAQCIEWYADGKLEHNNDHFEGWLRERIEIDCAVQTARGTRPMRIGDSKWSTIMNALLKSRAYNPYLKMLASLPPSAGQNLLETALLDENTFAADDTPLNREWLKILMVGMVMRIYKPGAHFRFMPVLQGQQNIGKSTFVRELALDPSWVSENIDLGRPAKEQDESMRGRVIAECSELSGMRRADIEKLKASITNRSYTGRLPYAKAPVQIMRTCVIVGTTNSDTPLPNDSENTRFIVLKCKKRWDGIAEWMARNRAQLWAEAKELYESGYRPYLSEELESAQALANNELADRDESVSARLMEYLRNRERRSDIELSGLLIADFLDHIAEAHSGLGKVHEKTVARALQSPDFSFSRKRKQVGGRRKYRWYPPAGFYDSQGDIPF